MTYTKLLNLEGKISEVHAKEINEIIEALLSQPPNVVLEATKEALTCQACKSENYGMTVCSHCIPNPSFSQASVSEAIKEAVGKTLNDIYEMAHKVCCENLQIESDGITILAKIYEYAKERDIELQHSKDMKRLYLTTQVKDNTWRYVGDPLNPNTTLDTGFVELDRKEIQVDDKGSYVLRSFFNSK